MTLSRATMSLIIKVAGNNATALMATCVAFSRLIILCPVQTPFATPHPYAHIFECAEVPKDLQAATNAYEHIYASVQK